MRKPTIHFNGTSVDHLLDTYTHAHAAIREAIDALAQTAPNGRDYYPQGDAAINEAMFEHQSRALRLKSVLREIEDLMVHVDQIKAA